MPNFSPLQLEEVAREILKAEGALASEAEIVAKYLVRANIDGTDSHGVQLLREYGKDVQDKIMIPGAKIVMVKETPISALLDCGYQWGHVVGERAMSMAIEKAEKVGIGTVSFRRSGHLGRMWDWSTIALEHDMIGFVVSNDDPIASPPGGNARTLGANPISFAIPAGTHYPIVIDCATSSSSGGRIVAAAAKGLRLAEGMIVDPEGRPSTDPMDYIQGGSLLPRGGYFGFALSLVVDALAGALSGQGTSIDNIREFQGGFFQAIKIDPKFPRAFHNRASAHAEMGRLDIGQSVAVKETEVIAVEAIERREKDRHPKHNQ